MTESLKVERHFEVVHSLVVGVVGGLVGVVGCGYLGDGGVMRVVGVLVVVLLLAVGCSGRGGSVESSFPSASPSVVSSVSPSVVVSPSVFESFPSVVGESGDRAAVRAGWLEYWRVYDKFMADPTVQDLTELQRVSTGEATQTTVSEIQDAKEAGYRSKGGFQFRDIVISEISSKGDFRTATIAYCLDRSKLTIEDREGNLVKEENFYYQETSTMVEGADSVWRVAQIRNSVVSSC